VIAVLDVIERDAALTVLLKVMPPELVVVRVDKAVVFPTAVLNSIAPAPELMVKFSVPLTAPVKVIALVDVRLVFCVNVVVPAIVNAPV